MTTKKLIVITKDQNATIKALADQLDMTQADVIRDALKAHCEAHGLEWPDDMPTWGGNRK